MEAVRKLERALVDPEESREDVSLAGGSTGIALIHAYVCDALGTDGSREHAERQLRRGAEALPGSGLDVSLYEGIAGVGWVAEHLVGRGFDAHLDAGDGVTDLVDRLLLEHVSRTPWDAEYDLISGLVGIGIYGLERSAHPSSDPLLATVLDRLEETAERTSEGISWETDRMSIPEPWRDRYPPRFRNLGVAHGVPGVVGFLGAARGLGVAPERVSPLLDGAVRWTLAHGTGEPGARFPLWDAPGEGPSPARSAWCYGDPGVATVLCVAARGAGEPAWGRAAAETLRDVALRPRPDMRVDDPWLCHGAAGLAHLHNRMFRATGDPWFADQALHWLEETLAMLPAHDPSKNPGFLTGAAGAGLVLLAAVTDVEPQWDRLLLASCRDPGASM
ncbi:MAG: lanthionine synthetase C family protein [Actinomycetota bacterium]